MTTRSQSKGRMLPLLRDAGQRRDKYKPFSIGDVQALADKLPSPAEGGGQWIDQLTQGHRLALRDFRALAARSMTRHDLLDVEGRAGTLSRSDEMELTSVVTKLSDAMREMFPAPSAAAVPKFTWDPKLHPREFLDKCKEDWTRRTGCHPGQEGVQREWFRRAVLEGVPETVRTAILNSPDLPGAESHIWDRHVVHHLQRATEEVQKEDSELKQLQAQLLKLQVGEARKKVNDEKKKRARETDGGWSASRRTSISTTQSMGRGPHLPTGWVGPTMGTRAGGLG